MFHSTNKPDINLLIEKINQLQDICHLNDIGHTLDLPQIIVLGSQSAGKSSVLEGIVNEDFLPKGTGIVTRRPLIIQLVYDANESYCTFMHSNIKFTDFKEVKREIITETQKELQNRNDVSDKPITLKIHSPKMLSLTLVDLPGLVRVPASDQPKTICQRIEAMCRRYASNRNAILLAVHAANTDISTSDALQLCRSVDPGYERTIGVLTKVDPMDQGTDLLDILSLRIIKLRFGFVPVIGRSQKETQEFKSLTEALKDEQSFFLNHPAYSARTSFCGFSFLVSKLNLILREHIRLCLPSLSEHIRLLIAKREEELGSFSALSPREQILRAISDVSRIFSEILCGNVDFNANEIIGGARINYALYETFHAFMRQIKPLESTTDEQIRNLYYNAGGSSSPGSFRARSFEKLIRGAIASLKPHSIKLVHIINSELTRIARQAVEQALGSRFVPLQEKILNSLYNLFLTRAQETQQAVQVFVDWNVAYINHKDFLYADSEIINQDGLNKDFNNLNLNNKDVIVNNKYLKDNNANSLDITRYGNNENEKNKLMHQINKNDPSHYKDTNKRIVFEAVPSTLKITSHFTQNELFEINLLKSAVNAYFDHTRFIFTDQIPKAIMSELVIKSELGMQAQLFKEVYEAEGVEKLLEESTGVRERRARVERELLALKQAFEIINSI